MSDAPERIMAECSRERGPSWKVMKPSKWFGEIFGYTQYIRADLYEDKCIFAEQLRERTLRDHDRISELEERLEAKVQGHNDLFVEAQRMLKQIAELEKRISEGVDRCQEIITESNRREDAVIYIQSALL